MQIHSLQGKQNKLIFFSFVWTVCTLLVPTLKCSLRTNNPLTSQDKIFHTDSYFRLVLVIIVMVFIKVSLDKSIHHTRSRTQKMQKLKNWLHVGSPAYAVTWPSLLTILQLAFCPMFTPLIWPFSSRIPVEQPSVTKHPLSKGSLKERVSSPTTKTLTLHIAPCPYSKRWF